VDYLYEEHCDNGKRRPLFGFGISLGSGVLSNYMGKTKENCKLDAAFGLGCHFDTNMAMDFLKSHMYGFYDYTLGINCRMVCKSFFIEYDTLVSKKTPEKVAVHELEKVLTISSDYSKLVARVAGYPTVLDYFNDCSTTVHMKNIQKPTFFLSAVDDMFFGPNVIPVGIESCNENILIGVTKTGGHCCYFTGSVVPTGQWFTEPAFEFFDYFVKEREGK
jgi:predicted alpha/beta-fold hydrolase